MNSKDFKPGASTVFSLGGIPIKDTTGANAGNQKIITITGPSMSVPITIPNGVALGKQALEIEIDSDTTTRRTP